MATSLTQNFSKEEFKKNVISNCKSLYRKNIDEADKQQVFQSVAYAVKDLIIDKWIATHKTYDKEDPKIVYYMSMEFLMGRALGNNMINLTKYNEIKEALEELGLDINVIEDQEPDAALGNGGLGRLAACFLDSIANLGLNGDGVGLNYHLGLFRQVFENGRQKEVPDYWIGKDSWLIPTDVSYKIDFADFSVNSRMYDINVYGEKTTNKLHLFDIDTVNEAIVNKSGIDFDKDDIKENLTLFLYPDDSDEKGRMLRIYQQYFMVSNGAKLIIDECKKKGSNLHDLYNYAVIQINDTHPTMVIPELIRLLMEEGIDIDEAIEKAVQAEHGNRHTAHMHSKNVDNLTKFARAVETTIFVKNAPSYAGIGFGGEGHTTFTIAGPTGEGLTSARSFTRLRRCVMTESFRII